MKVFADTTWFQALLNRRDEHHERAVAMSRGDITHTFTTEFVMLELRSAFSDPEDRADFLQMEQLARTRPDVTVVALSSDLMVGVTELFAGRPDKRWTLTDCVSFVVMKAMGITDALTSDQNFAQAGFRALLLEGGAS